MRKSYRPLYHVSVPFGWANDPNGTIYYQDKAHLYHQHYPHAPNWGPMHWLHVTTRDFIHWEQRPVALYPDKPYEVVCGCCSGSAVEADGKLWVMYTAAQPMMQRQCLAVSDDGGDHFTKYEGNPILTADMLSGEIYEEDFRDPRIFRKGDTLYLIAGIRYLDKAERKEPSPVIDQQGTTYPYHPSPEHQKEGWGNLCLLKGKDLFHWEYVGHLLYPQPEFSEEFYRLNGVYECPDYFVTDTGEEVLLSSPQNLPQSGDHYQNVHSTLYMLGRLDFETGQFKVRVIGEIDSGFDIYAPQTLRMPDGRVIMIAWKEMWDRNFPTAKEEWAGTYTLPRELSTDGDYLVQRPVREIEQFMTNPVKAERLEIENGETSVEGISGDVIFLSFELDPGTAEKAGVKLFCDGTHETLIWYDRKAGKVIFDRSRSGIEFTGSEENVNVRVCPVGPCEKVTMEIFLDVSSAELFINGGRHTMTGNVYPDLEKEMGVRFFAEGGKAIFLNIAKYDIEV
ncbi:MAG: glycoside hydrolase family 32 protein [Solobacterium sp.]|nr:glycoside hydrolase family 32 protein [Solobacterium sp.]